MIDNLIIRDERPDDAEAIETVTVEAFKTLAVSNQTEQFIVAALRRAGAMTVSLVAELNDRVIGHIAFSPVTIADGTPDWYGLGPVSVLPELHRRGIGRALIEQGLDRLRQHGARGCCLVGDPAFYNRFGFVNLAGFIHEGVPQEYFLALSFDGSRPQGEVAFHEAFKATGFET